ncbi:LOW QUALITY PROTEIN: hypothetical protein ACHAW5_009366 [Stephanodiscus triporus]|uniref:TLDc domain-containing protein n=1 Tax=Stephanodiscus triporus TaxID=2934178 RepID=A0ABD3N7Z3_9STRA
MKLAYCNLNAADDDLVEVNAGGKIVVAKRSTLTQIEGTSVVFSGRWDKLIQRDIHGRIFLDVNPTCFRAIVDYLNEVMISSEVSPPNPPSAEDEYTCILQHQLELFGLLDKKVPTIGIESTDSNIIKDDAHWKILHDWLKEDGSDGDLSLLYQGSRDGLSSSAFHSKCDNKGCTLTVIETTCGKVIGGYSKALLAAVRPTRPFLFALSDISISSPCKMKLKFANSPNAISCGSDYGPLFGGNDIYHPGPLAYGSFTIKEIEVFQVTESSPPAKIAYSKGKHAGGRTLKVELHTRFTGDINEAINANQECLLQTKSEMLQLEESFKNEQTFIEKFASGDAKDVVVLNVSDGVMVCTAEDSVLAQQFDDSKWTEQGCNSPRVKKWAKNIEDTQEDVSSILEENKITGCELLPLGCNKE